MSRTKLTNDFPQHLDGRPQPLPSKINLAQAKPLQWRVKLHLYPRTGGVSNYCMRIKTYGQPENDVLMGQTVIAAEVLRASILHQLCANHVSPCVQTDAISSIEPEISHPAATALTWGVRNWLK